MRYTCYTGQISSTLLLVCPSVALWRKLLANCTENVNVLQCPCDGHRDSGATGSYRWWCRGKGESAWLYRSDHAGRQRAGNLPGEKYRDGPRTISRECMAGYNLIGSQSSASSFSSRFMDHSVPRVTVESLYVLCLSRTDDLTVLKAYRGYSLPASTCTRPNTG